MPKKFEGKQVINGTWGQVWFDGEYLAQILACKAEVEYKKTEVQQACERMTGQKITGLEAKGEIKLHHINSFVMKKEQEAIKRGQTATHTIIVNLDDPDSAGAERIALYNCVLDKMILTDFENNKMGEESYSFTFDSWEIMESI